MTVEGLWKLFHIVCAFWFVAGLVGRAVALREARRALVVYLSTMPLIIVVFLPRGRVVEAALAEAAAQGRVTPRLTAAFDDRAVALAHQYEWVALAVVIVLMVLKPF